MSFDTEEALEEVFWLTMAGQDYVRPDALVPHEIDAETARAYAAFVGSVLAAQPGNTRYLAKNNNNCLRMSSLRRALPKAYLIVPFRDPVQHALSLLRQHRHFEQVQQSDQFSLSYMRWLGHFEFGLDHRPFVFGDYPDGRRDEPAYWLDLWIKSYQGILDRAPAGTVFWDFDAFCANPDVLVASLLDHIQLSARIENGVLDAIKPPHRSNPGFELPEGLQASAEKLHAALVKCAVR